MQNPYLKALTDWLAQHADAENAAPMAKYMRDQFAFLGIKTPQRRELVHTFLKTHGQPPVDQLELTVLALWALPEREYQYTALALLEKRLKKLPPDAAQLFETLITTKSWWDTVDTLAGSFVGPHFRRHPQAQAAYLPRWRQSKNMWLRRTAILFQLKHKTQTNVPLLFAIITENLGSDEFFINKAIGWALREYSKTDATAVRTFVQQTDLHPLSQREALKWLQRQDSNSKQSAVGS